MSYLCNRFYRLLFSSSLERDCCFFNMSAKNRYLEEKLYSFEHGTKVYLYVISLRMASAILSKRGRNTSLPQVHYQAARKKNPKSKYIPYTAMST